MSQGITQPQNYPALNLSAAGPYGQPAYPNYQQRPMPSPSPSIVSAASSGSSVSYARPQYHTLPHNSSLWQPAQQYPYNANSSISTASVSMQSVHSQQQSPAFAAPPPYNNAQNVHLSVVEEIQLQRAMEVSLLQDKITALERRNSELQSSNQSDLLKEALKQERLQRAKLEDELAKYPGQIFALEKQLEQEKYSVENLRGQLLESGSNAQIAKLRMENESLRARLAIAESNQSLLADSSDDAKRRLEEKTFECIRLTKELDEVRTHLEKANEAPPLLRNEISRLTEQLRSVAVITQQERKELIERYEKEAKERKYEVVNQSTTPDEFFVPNPVDTTKLLNGVPACPRNIDPELWSIFCEADPYNSEKLDLGQLTRALASGPWPPLSLKTVRYIARCFDRQGNFITFQLFEPLWAFVIQLKISFASFDKTRISEFEWGHCPAPELRNALKEAGITVSTKVIDLYMQRNNQNCT